MNTEGQNDKRYFVNIADAGIGGIVVDKINRSKKIFGANFTFFSAITTTYLTYRATEVLCTTEDFKWQGKALSIVVANGKYLPFAPTVPT